MSESEIGRIESTMQEIDLFEKSPIWRDMQTRLIGQMAIAQGILDNPDMDKTKVDFMRGQSKQIRLLLEMVGWLRDKREKQDRKDSGIPQE